jgi:hypothetical protein
VRCEAWLAVRKRRLLNTTTCSDRGRNLLLYNCGVLHCLELELFYKCEREDAAFPTFLRAELAFPPFRSSLAVTRYDFDDDSSFKGKIFVISSGVRMQRLDKIRGRWRRTL